MHVAVAHLDARVDQKDRLVENEFFHDVGLYLIKLDDSFRVPFHFQKAFSTLCYNFEVLIVAETESFDW